ncbi:MAG TPA: VTC domain-containing protein [Vicinamibacterales bacterium]|nr:VTC domain-containing protein [Vicinamibacterales bacterium]
MLQTKGVAQRPIPDAGERELKFTLPVGRSHLARRRLDTLCRRDPEFPAAIVWTIYYDSPALASLGEKINSDYLKRKIRVRWYSDLEGRVSGPAFVEAKFRLGTQRSKVRARLPFPAEEIAAWNLQDRRMSAAPLLLRDHGVLGHESWQPVLLLRYRRDRFIEPLTRSRVSLDADICGAAANARFLSAPNLSPLATAVLEVKGSSEELSAPMRPLLALGMRKGSFSKFLAVYAHMTREVL